MTIQKNEVGIFPLYIHSLHILTWIYTLILISIWDILLQTFYFAVKVVLHIMGRRHIILCNIFFILLFRSSWGFHANLTHEKVEKVLRQNGIHGNYVCRRSQTTPGCYTLSVRYFTCFYLNKLFYKVIDFYNLVLIIWISGSWFQCLFSSSSKPA